jgi:hypothetical protein
MNDTTASLLLPLGFKPAKVFRPNMSTTEDMLVLELPGTTSRLAVHGDGSASARRDVTLWLETHDGLELHHPVDYRNCHRLVADLRAGVWDGFGNSTLRLKST